VIEDKRVLDWVEREHEDFVFGKLLTRSVFVRGNVSDKGAVRPDLEVNVRVKEGQEVIERFLRGQIDVDGGQTDGFLVEEKEGVETGADEGGKGLWVHTLEINEKSAWRAETVCISFLSLMSVDELFVVIDADIGLPLGLGI
jgi:hypothetical protein